MFFYQFLSTKRLLLFVAALSLCSCSRKPDQSFDPLLFYQREELPQDFVDLSPWLRQTLSSVHIVDSNGMTQTHSIKERLRSFVRLNPLENQPYKQLTLLYKSKRSEPMGILASYYPNGNIMQLLTTFNGSARGIYCEWHDNGQLSLKGRVVGGKPILGEVAQDEYLFDGTCYAWNQHGEIVAQIEYDGGKRNGDYITYHAPNKLWYKATYKDGKLEGNLSEYTSEGYLLRDEWYKNDLLHGSSKRYHSNGRLQGKETYTMGSLKSAHYWCFEGKSYTPKVENFEGVQIGFEHTEPARLMQIKRGRVEGKVYEFNAFGELAAEYQLHQDYKEGISIDYYTKKMPTQQGLTQLTLALRGKILFEPHFWKERYYDDLDWDLVRKSHGSAPHFCLMWSAGLIQGKSITWYPNGVIKAEREIIEEASHGQFNTYYVNGDLRSTERYDRGVLLTGQYWRIGDTQAISQIEGGKGVAIIFDDHGYNRSEIQYTEGVPSLPVSSQR